MTNLEECVQNLELLWDRYLTVRSAFPYFRADDVGKLEKRSAGFYRLQGKDLTVHFPAPISQLDIEKLNGVGYWVNQSLIISAWALLEHHRLVGNAIKLDSSRPGFEDVNILHRLRKVFAHTNGRYNPENKEERLLFEKMEKRYRMGIVDGQRFNLQIDEVLKPMLEGVKTYVQASPP